MVSYDRARLGTFIWIRSHGTGALLYCQVTDESAGSAKVVGSDKWRHMQVNLVEFDYASSQRMCIDWNGPWRLCKVDILR